jgi:monothiol glutaredoxin
MSDAVREQIQQTIDSNRVVVFMKGTKNFPQCGFSAAVSDVMQRMGVDFTDVNVLADYEIREGIKRFSNWPTIPQVYVDGEFLGGCDITLEMFQSGELQKKLGVAEAE